MSVNDYLMIVKKLLIKRRSIVRESHKYYKVYLPAEYNEVWGFLHKGRRRVDVVIFLPRIIDAIDKILMMNRFISKENDRYKLYLDKRYNSIWENIHRNREKVDLIIMLK